MHSLVLLQEVLTDHEIEDSVWRSKYLVKNVPKLHEPIAKDSNWVSIEDDFVMVQAAYMSHLQVDGFVVFVKQCNTCRLTRRLFRFAKWTLMSFTSW